MRHWRVASVALAAMLCGAAPSPAPPGVAPAAPSVEPARRPLATNEAIADQFTMLAFDADPTAGGPPREHLARWQEPIRLFVNGSDADVRLAAANAALLGRLTNVPIALVSGGAPNLLVAVTADPPGLFAGPLRRLLLGAFSGDTEATDTFMEQVVKVEPCWILAVWGDVAQTIIKAAVVGIDGRQPRSGIERCVAQKLAAAMGLLGPSGYLPRSVFAPQTGATHYSLEDGLMLRLLYSTALRPGMSREEAHAAALATLPTLRRR